MRPRPTRATVPALGLGVLVGALVGALVSGCSPTPPTAGGGTTTDGSTGSSASSLSTTDASGVPLPSPDPDAGRLGRAFLDRYVDADGRVVRHDQGGDTVSEGQAYALLVAVAVRDRDTFDRVWAWTREHLLRTDGRLAWRWDGAVVGQDSASDADLDTAWALAMAAHAFGSDDDARDAAALGAALLDRATAPLPDGGRVLLAGSQGWMLPATVNPSYFNPRGGAALQSLTGDTRWGEVADGDRAVVRSLLDQVDYPPDWARVAANGTVTPSTWGDAATPAYGLDAARIGARYAQSCAPDDQAVAASLWPRLRALGESPVGSYSVDGKPLVTWTNPLMWTSAAATARAAGDADGFDRLLGAAQRADGYYPTYYGSAWIALTALYTCRA
ncbi:glycosyl hydrolase family 8 [Luteimicrobium subarcticum]|uniref:Endoglucanase n=1 Tax=Luteimicrobium subarcticum TaxID=620910 RepID=A0A2M8WS44_9MICO|nr:glycosyl hydrolase family 8 [Luteimicrobium subarcticum]PJI93656.1 endoglucanase [Luteimicrobium subarcticum]